MFSDKKKTAHILIAYLDQGGVFKFALQRQASFTFYFSYDSRFSVFSQIKSFLKEEFLSQGHSEGDFEVHESFREILAAKGEVSSSRLYFVSCQKPLLMREGISLLSLPELFRSLPKGRERLLFLKAFQLLSDDQFHLIRAREVSEKELLEEKLL